MDDTRQPSVRHSHGYVNLILIVLVALNLSLVAAMRIVGSQMYPFFIMVYIWIPVYISLVCVLLYRESLATNVGPSKRSLVCSIVVLTVAARLLFLGQTQSISLDALWYLDFGKLMQMGEVPYTEFYFPYPPVFAYFIFIIVSIVPSVDSFRVLAAFMDGFVVLVLFRLARELDVSSRGTTIALAYALLPISIIESGWNGHFEPIVTLFLLLSMWFLLRGQARLSGLSLGLSIATKVYPLALFPLYLFYLKRWRPRIDFTLVMTLSIAVTFMPILALGGAVGVPAPNGSSSIPFPLGLLLSVVGFFSNPDLMVTAANALLIVAVVLGILLTVRQFLKGTPLSNWHEYQWVMLTLGLVLIIGGLIAGTYPLTPASRLVSWRYPADVGVVKGAAIAGMGIMIVLLAYESRRRLEVKGVSSKSLLILVSATVLFLLAMSRAVVFAWYFLWSVPLFLLVRNRHLGLTFLFCLLLAYPSYTHDNFVSLGFEEQRLWGDEFVSVSGWSCRVDVSDSGLTPSQITCGIYTDGSYGHFWTNTTGVENETLLRNVSVSFTRNASVTYDSTTEFVARIGCSWDPTFGSGAAVSLAYDGKNNMNESIEGVIIPKTTIFTNLTFIPWRYAFLAEPLDSQVGNIENLTITAYPYTSGTFEHVIDFFYTVRSGPLNPDYFLVVPLLAGLALAAYVILRKGLSYTSPSLDVDVQVVGA